MAITFESFTRENIFLRQFLMGPTGAGKTVGALEIATNLFGGALKVGVLDSEHGRAKLNADKYSVAEYAQIAGDFAPEQYVRALNMLAERGCEVVVIDSISHEWMGPGGILQQADRFGDWKVVRPKHAAFVEALLAVPTHVIVTCRAKMKYEVGEEEVSGRTKQVIRKLGLGPIQSDDIIYEFDVVGVIDAVSHETTFSNRCDPLVDQTFSLRPGTEVAEILTKWLSEGEPPEPPEAASKEAVDALVRSLLEEGYSTDVIEERFAKARTLNRGELSPGYVAEQTEKSVQRLAAKTGVVA